jgi:hypothetical protein
MTFEQKIFQHFCELIPGLTTRQFSQLCGRSDNYYCSLQSQNLSMSDAALINLAEVLDCYSDFRRDEKLIKSLRVSLAEELARRRSQIATHSSSLRTILANSFARRAYEQDWAWNPPAPSVGWQT